VPPEAFRGFPFPILGVMLRAFMIAEGETAVEITADHLLQAIDSPAAEAPRAGA
jgi:hypothetical protein